MLSCPTHLVKERVQVEQPLVKLVRILQAFIAQLEPPTNIFYHGDYPGFQGIPDVLQFQSGDRCNKIQWIFPSVKLQKEYKWFCTTEQNKCHTSTSLHTSCLHKQSMNTEAQNPCPFLTQVRSDNVQNRWCLCQSSCTASSCTFHLSPHYHFQRHYHLYIPGLKETWITSF